MNRRNFLTRVAGAATTLPLFTLSVCRQKTKKPNIVFVLIDDMGWKDVGFMGADFYETPAIDRLAKNGKIFTNAYAGAPNCAPTRACIMTGMYTPRHKIYTPGGASKGDPRLMKLRVPVREHYIKGIPDPSIYKNVFESRDEALAPQHISIAEVLNEAGYKTARLGKWHLGKDTQGFDVNSSDGTHYRGPLATDRKNYGDPLATDRLTDASLKFIEENKTGPFFLYLPLWDVHSPFVAKQNLIDKYNSKQKAGDEKYRHYDPTYAAMIETVDHCVKRIMVKLEALNIDKNTLVIFSSDNGGSANVSMNKPLRGGKGSLYEGGIRVPTCMYWPGVIEAGTTCDIPVTSVDFLPTFSELAGAKLPASQPVDGQSFVPLLQGKRALTDRAVFWHFPLYLRGEGRQNFMPLPGGTVGKGVGWRTTPASAIRKGDWKLIEFFQDNRIELYNLKDDLGETSDLARENSEKARELLDELDAWQESTKAPVPSEPNPYYGPQYRSKL